MRFILFALTSAQLAFGSSLHNPSTAKEYKAAYGLVEEIGLMELKANKLKLDLSRYKDVPNHVSLTRKAAIYLSGEFHECSTCRSYHKRLIDASHNEEAKMRFLHEAPPTDDNPLEDRDVYLLDGTLEALRIYSEAAQTKTGGNLEHGEATNFAVSIFGYGQKEFLEILPDLRKASKSDAAKLEIVVSDIAKQTKNGTVAAPGINGKLPAFFNQIQSQKVFVEYALSVLAVRLLKNVEAKYPELKFPKLIALYESKIRPKGVAVYDLKYLFNRGVRNWTTARNLMRFYFEKAAGNDVGMASHWIHVEGVFQLLKAGFEKYDLDIPIAILSANLDDANHSFKHPWLPEQRENLETLRKALPIFTPAVPWLDLK